MVGHAACRKPFSFEAGLLYWYSSALANRALSNTESPFGNPTSTTDWKRMRAHTGEVFARIDQDPTGLFVKGIIGGGSIVGGRMVDKDFLVGQCTFSNTSSDSGDGRTRCGMIDLGVVVAEPSSIAPFGAFVGYHYWREKMTAYGLTC